MDNGFTDEQSSAIEWFEGPMMVLGTPGSGKTTVITNRIINLIYEHGVSPAHILVITFTRAAASSMKERFLSLIGEERTSVRFGTFHSFFYWIIRTAYGNMGVLDETTKRQVIRNILREIDKESYDNEETLTSVLNQLGIMSCEMIDIENYYSRDMSDDDFRRLYKAYKKYKKDNILLDFDDMVTECYRLLDERRDILQKIREMYPYIMVDEYQDTNRIQYEILKLLAHPNDNLYVVGDDDQSVYGFRGARPDIMLQFENEFPGAKISHLSQNFRCPEKIVKLSSYIISGNKNRYQKVLSSASPKDGNIIICKVKDARKENEAIVKRIQEDIAAGIRPSDIAVLYRTNNGPRRLLYKLREYGIEYTVRDAITDIFSHPYIKPVIDYISYALGDHSRKTFLNIMNRPVRYISRDMLRHEQVEMIDLCREYKDKDYIVKAVRKMNLDIKTIERLDPYAAINYIRETIGYNRYLREQAQEKNMDLDYLMELMDEFQSLAKECTTFGELYDMIEDSQELAKKQSENGRTDTNKGVQLMTLHSSKGLEFSSVHIMDLVEENIPHKRAKTENELEEERRLLYVGVTRSSDRLSLYIPEYHGEDKAEPSRFVKGLIDETGRNKKRTGRSR